MREIEVIEGDCLEVLERRDLRATCIFADPPDNIGLGYEGFSDDLKPVEYLRWLDRVMRACVQRADVFWLSFNAKWTMHVGALAYRLSTEYPDLDIKPCVQTFTFGQHRHSDLGNNHRPLWRFMKPGAKLYPDAIRVPSWRQENGDPRADPRGRVPGDVFDFPRVTGNSKQRRPWHPTQLNEELVKRCLLLTTAPGDLVIDVFTGTGTTLRVAREIGRPSIGIELSRDYVRELRRDLMLGEPQCEERAA